MKDKKRLPGKLEYSKSTEDIKNINIKSEYELFIGGKWIKTDKYFKTINPSNEEFISKVAYAGEKEINIAVRSAKRAYEKFWKNTSPKEKAKYIYRIARILQEKVRDFSVIETLNSGKPIRESKSFDIPLAISHFFYYSGWTDKLQYAINTGKEIFPAGVIGQIIPSDFPFLMGALKIAPALACGNTVVIKSSEITPLSLIKFAEVIQEAGLPEGVVNIVSGDGKTGSYIVNHPDVKMISFSGSAEVGKLIMKAKAGTDKKLMLELGGKTVNIIFEDAPLDAAVEGIINSIYFNQGHIFSAGSRILVQESIKETLIKKLKFRMKYLRTGDPLDRNTDIGAISSKKRLNKIKELVKSGIKEGAGIFQTECELPGKGYWFRPTLFTKVSQSNRVANEEIPGPVLSILTFRTPSEAVEKANNILYGLSAGIWTDKGSKAFGIMNQIKAGVIWCNTINKFNPASPFGGFKESGFGREGSRQGLLEYIEY